MSFLSPIWLLGLVPWAGVVLFLLIGRLKRVRVPFLQLWHGPETKPRERRGIEPPPAWLVLAMLAMLLGVLAAARPVRRDAAGDSQLLTIILDRGLTMSARGKTDLRYHELAPTACQAILRSFGPGPAELRTVPHRPPVRMDRSAAASFHRDLTPTALDTRDMLQADAMQALADSRGPVFVLSDQQLRIANDRLIQIAPDSPLRNVGIVRLAVREGSASQAMVTLRNQSELVELPLKVLSDGAEVARTRVQLPAGAERDFFLDLPRLGQTITAELEVQDDLPADNRAYLAREQSWPVIETRVPLRPELQRVIEVYSRLRPPSPASRHVAIVPSISGLPLTEPAAVISEPPASSPTSQPTQTVTTMEHPVTRAIADWSHAASEPSADAPDEANWIPIVKAGSRVLVAAREQPARQLWVGFASDSFARRPEFVIFWTNAFNWLGQGSAGFVAHRAAPLGPGWSILPTPDTPAGVAPGTWPGIYRNADGALRAVNALAPAITPAPPTDWRGRTADLTRQRQVSGLDAYRLDQPLLLLALALILLSALTWRRPLRAAPMPQTEL